MAKKVKIKNRFEDSMSEMVIEEKPFGMSVSITEREYDADAPPINYLSFSLGRSQIKAVAEFYQSTLIK